MSTPFKKWYQTHQDEIIEDFINLLKFKSISTDPKYKQDVIACGTWVKDYLEKAGLDVEVWDTPTAPIYFASHLKAGKDRPTLLLYHHYDVQPEDPIDEWKSPPFEPEVRDGRVYGRGACDNKGQFIFSINAVKAFLECAEQVQINIKICVEGEEEVGSSAFLEMAHKKKSELKADYLLIVDTTIPEENTPAVTLGVRGITALEVECTGSSTDLHSGLYGGVAYNPNKALMQMLAKCFDEKGRVAVPGFYDNIELPEKSALAQIDLSYDLKEEGKRIGVTAFSNEEGVSLTEGNWLRPTLEINGMSGGYTGDGVKSVIPARSIAKLSCRLVPGQDADHVMDAIETFLKKIAPEGIGVKVVRHAGSGGVITSPESTLVKVLDQAFESVFDKKCLHLLCGASIPVTAVLQEVSEAQMALIGLAVPEDGMHAPNECFGVKRLEKGFMTMTALLEGLAKE